MSRAGYSQSNRSPAVQRQDRREYNFQQLRSARVGAVVCTERHRCSTRTNGLSDIVAPGRCSTFGIHIERHRWGRDVEHGHCANGQRLNQCVRIKPELSGAGYLRIFRALEMEITVCAEIPNDYGESTFCWRSADFYLPIEYSGLQAWLRMHRWAVKHPAILQSKAGGVIRTNNTVAKQLTL